jgi:hypothetical protein
MPPEAITSASPIGLKVVDEVTSDAVPPEAEVNQL